MKFTTFLSTILALFSTQKAEASTSCSWFVPKPDITWHWQLDGKVNKNVDAELFIIDLYDTTCKDIKKLHKKGKKVIAYFSAGSYEAWRNDSKQFKKCELGKKMDGWDEKWIDIRSNNVRQIMIDRLKLAKQKGFDGVEADNVDGYQNNTGFKLKAKDQLNYNIFLANNAHKLGLSIALKNDIDQIKELEPYFDFHINEECHKYKECKKTLPFIKANKAVLNAEYQKKKHEKICKKSKKLGLNTMILPLELDGSFRITCR